jgi:hypothetical protein
MFYRTRGKLMVALLAAAALGGCGGSSDDDDDGGSSCGTFTACGGDVVGTWTLTNFCTVPDVTDLPAECQNNISVSSSSGSGTYEFTETDYSSSLMLQFTMRWVFDNACVSALADQSVTMTEASCASLEQEYRDRMTAQQVSCSFAGGACLCDFLVSNAFNDAGPYTLQGTDIDDGSAVPAHYCVDGDTLKLEIEDNDSATIVTLVFQRG